MLHDVRWPGRVKASLDHVVLGPGGVVVIDAKNWTGTVDVHDGELRQNGYRRTREVQGVADAAAAVTALLEPAHRMAVCGVLCLAAHDVEPAATSTGVTVVGLPHLTAYLSALPPRLSPYEVADIGRFLAAELDPVDRRPSRSTRNKRNHSPVYRPASQPRRHTARRARLLLRLLFVVFGLWLVLGAVSSMLSTLAAGSADPSPQPSAPAATAPAVPSC